MAENAKLTSAEQIVVKFTGDSGDGMQLIGNQLTALAALDGNDVNSLPDYPSEIRAPAGTIAGVSGFQMCLGDHKIYTAGDAPDVLVGFNPAAVKHSSKFVKAGGMIITNSDSFTEKAMTKVGYEGNPLEDGSLSGYDVKAIPMTTLVREALADMDMPNAAKDRCKNFFVMGVLCWLFGKDKQLVLDFIQEKFGPEAKKPLPKVAEANSIAYKTGLNYAETTIMFQERYDLGAAQIEKGLYRNITGNDAAALAIAAAGEKAGLQPFIGSYPITPATDLLHYASEFKDVDLVTMQMEDEIAGICTAIGASCAGNLAFTTTSGPGLALKTEAAGMAIILEVPLVIVNVQRGGPSTGLPTKTEQSDLLQSMFGRNGDSYMPIIAANSPADCFDATFQAAKIALQYRTPVIVLTDGYIGQGSCPWKVPTMDELEDLRPYVNFWKPEDHPSEEYVSYKRDPETLARDWAIPGTKGCQHRIGTLEKDETGAVSHDPMTHQRMTEYRKAKVDNLAQVLPGVEVNGKESNKILVVSWGGTYGAVKGAVDRLIAEGKPVSGINLRWVWPFPPNLGEIISRFDKILVPELNMGQLSLMLRAQFLVDVQSLSKVQGDPFREYEVIDKVNEMLGE
ncbi:MAG: 2-oxoacid:acceptor oxidoreductase subunit alpha [Thermodesulfobacteriota bacterium]|nr:2-oxoacid:acceptor oxidoreductase subunit alpha [Thermodesulfobacteriota bacterium]